MLLLWLTLSGCVLGVLGVWLAAQPMTASACVVAAAYGICCGILIGAPLSLIHALTRRSKKLVALWGWCRDRLMAIADDRESVVRFHARLIAVMLLASGTALLLRRVSWLLVTIQDEALSADFRLLTGFGVPILALLLALPLVRVLAAALRVIDRRWRLTWKLRREATVYVVLPGTLILLGLLRRHHDTLGGLLAVVVVLLLFLLALPMLLPAQRLPIRSRRVALFVGAAVGALAVLVVGFRTHHRAPSAARAADATAFARLAQPILLAAGDPDRDGASAWLGGRDCSPFDPAISPNAIDVPKNGIDEDCDGADATGVLSVDRPKQLYSGLGRTPGSVKNVVLVVIDAVRMDHTSLVPGYEHRSTPNLEDLAEASFLYTNALSQSSATLFSMPSMLMGRNPDQALWTYEARHTSVTDQKSLPELLRPFGFHSAIVVNSYIIDNYSGVARGFDEVLDAWKGRTARGASGSAITLGIEYIERRLRDPEGSPFLLTLYFDDPHAPYIPHKAFPYGNEQKDLHIGEVAHSDAMFAFFIEYLKNRAALWDDTMLIVTSDHGEEFGEHGGRFHATNCHIESVHVPLIMRIPGVADTKKVVASPVALIDIVPTILEAIGHQDYTDLDGQSLLLPALAPDTVGSRTIRCAVASQRAGSKPFLRRAFRNGRHTLIEDDGKATLYDAVSDKAERSPLTGHETELRALLEYARTTTTGNLAAHAQY